MPFYNIHQTQEVKVEGKQIVYLGVMSNLGSSTQAVTPYTFDVKDKVPNYSELTIDDFLIVMKTCCGQFSSNSSSNNLEIFSYNYEYDSTNGLLTVASFNGNSFTQGPAYIHQAAYDSHDVYLKVAGWD